MPTIDELGRNAADTLRSRLEATIDIDEGLRTLGDTQLTTLVSPPSHSSRRAWRLAGAAAAAVAVGVAFLADGDDAITPATDASRAETVSSPEPAPTTAAAGAGSLI